MIGVTGGSLNELDSVPLSLSKESSTLIHISQPLLTTDNKLGNLFNMC